MFAKTSILLLVLFSSLVFPRNSRADLLQIQLGCGSPISTTGPGPLTNTASCPGIPGGGTVTETDLASYQSLGSIVTATYSGTSSGSLGGVQDQAFQNITVGGIPDGTTIDLDFELQITGSYAYDIASTASAAVFLFPTITVGSKQVSTELIPIYACGSPGNSNCESNSGSLVSTSGSAEYSAEFFTGAIPVVVGTPIQLGMALDVQSQVALEAGTMTADFLDPTYISNIEATNTSGQSLSGVTATSDTGVVYLVNGVVVTPVPEPSEIGPIGALIALLGAFSAFSCSRGRSSRSTRVSARFDS
jgi:hypothetical protein